MGTILNVVLILTLTVGVSNSLMVGNLDKLRTLCMLLRKQNGPYLKICQSLFDQNILRAGFSNRRAMLQLQVVTEEAPPCVNGACAVASGCIYLHGGTKTGAGGPPQGAIYKFDPSSAVWTKLSDDGPAASHHDVFVSEDRFLNFVGGWDGKTRSKEISVFDIKDNKWLKVPETQGFPAGAGLSSHAVTGCTDGSALVIGRLGGLKTQRKTSAVLKIVGDHRKGFTYKTLQLEVESRSGHSVVPIDGTQVAIVGGKSEPHRNIDVQLLTYKGTQFSTSKAINLENVLGPHADETGKNMFAARRYQSAGHDAAGRIVCYGGEGFESLMPNKSVDPRGDIAVWDTALMRKNCTLTQGIDAWHTLKLDKPLPRLTGHCMVMMDYKIYIIGGTKKANKANSETIVLGFPEELKD